jgi:hypothetical protein
MKTNKRRHWGRIIGLTCIALALLAVIGGLVLRRQISPDLRQDIRAGIAARNLKNPDERLNKYLEVRYGPQDDPANRQKVFLNMFNPEHIKSMQILVKHSPESQRQTNIMAMARWVEHYRNSLTPEERAALSAQLQTDGGRSLLRQSSAQYNLQDVRYRGMTAPVVSQLLITISQLQKK